MIDGYVSLEQAKRLKSMGFCRLCELAFQPKDDDLFFDKPDNWNGYKDTISIPSYQQILRWFRKKYNIYISVEWYYKSENDKTVIYAAYITSPNGCPDEKSDFCDTFEDAMNTAIDITLNYLERDKGGDAIITKTK